MLQVWAISHHLYQHALEFMEFAGGLRQRSNMFNFRTVYSHMAGRVRSHERTQCYITGASFESFSRVLVGCHRYYEQDNMWCACVDTAQGQQCPQLPKSMFTSYRN